MNKNRHANKKAKKCQGGAFVDKVPVMGMLERGGNVVCKVVIANSAVRNIVLFAWRIMKNFLSLQLR